MTAASVTALVVDALGFLTGIVLYAMLGVMVWRERRLDGDSLLSTRGRLPFVTSVCGVVWNVGALLSFGVRFTDASLSGPVPVAVAFAALGFLPAVVVHSLLEGDETSVRRALVRATVFGAYLLSIIAGALHAVAAIQHRAVPSSVALWLLTIGFTTLMGLLLVMTRGQRQGRRGLWVAALSIFAVSAFHFNRHAGNEAWSVELVGHHASLALAFAILLQDYRFAFADLFLKNAIALLFVVASSLAVFAGAAMPILRAADGGRQAAPRAIALVIVLWIATVLSYLPLRRFASRVVDRVMLRRPDYQRALEDLSVSLDAADTDDAVVSATSEAIAAALSLTNVRTVMDMRPYTPGRAIMTRLEPGEALLEPGVAAVVRLGTVDPPHPSLILGSLPQGSRLLSDDLNWLEAVARVSARRLDGLRVARERLHRRLREEAMERLATEAELRALRAQLQPHFLFNALTTIGYLIRHSPSRALDTLLGLTNVLRAVLRRTTADFSTVGEEVDLIRSYLDIEQARFEERLQIVIDADADARACQIPTLLLQPLVENAVKHGISPLAEGGTVIVRAHRRNATLRLIVVDTGMGFTPKTLSSTGLGLRSVEDRLRVHYGNSGTLRIRSTPGHGATIEIELPARVSTAAAPAGATR